MRRAAQHTIALLAALQLGSSPASRAPARDIEEITVDDAVARMHAAEGHPAVIVFYKTNCPRTQAMFPSLVALTQKYALSGVSFLAFSVDDEEEKEDIPGFLAHYSAPFPAVYVQPWVSGTFGRAMAGFGIRIGATWTTPLVAVRAADGSLVLQAQGPTDVSILSQVLARLQ